jgi:glycosyltransferase involved in cell wall biosynthesis
MKKLCIITPTVPKYSETFIKNHIELLPFDTTVITSGGGQFADFVGKPLASSALLSRIFRYLKRKLFKQDWHYQQELILASFMSRRKFDHVLFEYGTTAKKAFRACVRARIPYTVHFHGYDAYTYEYDQNYYHEVFEHATGIIAVSQHMRNKLIELGADKEKIHVILYGVPKQTPQTGLSNSATPFRFVAIGRFVEKKAPYLTILAFYKALHAHGSLRLTMIGDGPLLGICKDIVNSLKLEDSISFKGSLTHEETIRELTKAHAFIQHSKTSLSGDSEGMPVAIIEASMLRKPVISTLHSGIPEVVTHGENGFLVEEGDIEGMAQMIIKSLSFQFTFTEPKEHRLSHSIDQLAYAIDRAEQ